MRWLHALGHALAISGSMTWEILWALILGFALSAVVQAVVRRTTIIRRLGDDRPKTLAVAAGLGADASFVRAVRKGLRHPPRAASVDRGRRARGVRAGLCD